MTTGSSPTTRTVELSLFFLIGIFGTGHCLGMCGPLVSIYSDRIDAKEGTRAGQSMLSWYVLRQHLLFNAGRVTIYTLLGAAFGLLGSVLFATADVTIPYGNEVRGVAGLAIGVVVVLAGASYLSGRAGAVVSGDLPVVGPVFSRTYRFLSARIDNWVGGPRIFGLGFVHGFLPCPLLYPAFLYAFAQADPVTGAASLFVLGLGTFPALFLYGTLFQSADFRHRRLVHRALGAVFVLLGVHTLTMALRLLGFAVPHLFSLPVYQPLG
ncbi:sulfite exporter TauE/SafE family protein [Halobacteriaceae archaeon GCM10025711]